MRFFEYNEHVAHESGSFLDLAIGVVVALAVLDVVAAVRAVGEFDIIDPATFSASYCNQ